MGDPRPEVGDRWPLVGRDRQLSALTTMIAGGEKAPTGASPLTSAAGGGVVLVGAAGVGKTRLAREVLARLASEGCRTEWVSATRSMAAIPFGAVSPLLPPLNNDSRLSVLHAVAAHFTDSPVIAVDDAHLLDDASAAVVHHLALSGQGNHALTP
ncbi:ATP-binding protein [Kibdelosporangium philippinense]|uniref:ATP-binding protein n=1 Tax=Kibdelosporangium philippinense TaxID=211113 RepID=A0ABS8ZVH6_9PSEU|nr:ATP-binding protein [Kibdelosporangium philippinense]MCE7011602.1 ATP-binding protein [Kibdelosporangium philippinense]